MKKTEQKTRLDQFALDIEFLLISVIQGLALSVLATTAVEPLKNLQYEYWLYVFASFLLILLFWSQAIIHAFSFINWPISLPHTFLYFLIGFIEVIAFTQITNPLSYFLFMTLFSIISLILYWLDLGLMKKFRTKIITIPGRKKLADLMIKEHLFELKTLVPIGILFNGLITFFIFLFNDFFIEQKMHIYLILTQSLIFLIVLTISAKSYKTRAHLLEEG